MIATAAQRNSCGSTRSHYPFTENQWEELEKQVLTFRYIMSGIPIPPPLIPTSTSTLLFPHLQQLPIGLGCFQAGYGYGRKVDPEPGRCKRTDGKKWRCSKEAHPDSKYCERHMNRGKSKAKKQFDALNNNSTTKTVTNININPKTTATQNSHCLPYPAISYSSVSPSSYPNKFQADNNTGTTFYPFLSAQSESSVGMSSTRDDDISPHWLGLDGEFHDQSDDKEIRYSNQLKEVNSTTIFQDNGCNYKINAEEEKHQEETVGNDDEQDTQKLYHHFLGDWPTKPKTSRPVGLFSESN